MIDVLAVALAAIAATLLVDNERARASTAAVGLWLVIAALLAADHGLFPGLAFAVAAATVPVALAVLAAPYGLRAIRAARLAAGGIALIAIAGAIVGALAGASHGA